MSEPAVWSFEGFAAEPILVARAGEPFDPPLVQVSATLAETLLRRWLADPPARRTLLDVHAALFFRGGADVWPDGEILADLVGAFERGDLVLLGLPDIAGPGLQPVKPPSIRPPRPDKRAWIEIELLDANRRRTPAELVVTPPVGPKLRPAFSGFLRIENLDAGPCDIEFPKIDGREWGPSPMKKPDPGTTTGSQPYTVQPGDYLVKIARAHGFADFRTVYGSPSNAAFRTKRPNPDIIFQGDQLMIPDHEDRLETRSTESRHTFHTLAGAAPELRVVLQDGAGAALSGKRCVLHMGREVIGVDGTLKTDKDGLLQHPLDPRITQVKLEVFLDDKAPQAVIYRLRVGSLDPIEEVSGVQARLMNLGFPCAITGTVGEDTVAALQDFRSSVGITVGAAQASTIDGATRSRLQKEHGS